MGQTRRAVQLLDVCADSGSEVCGRSIRAIGTKESPRLSLPLVDGCDDADECDGTDGCDGANRAMVEVAWTTLGRIPIW